MPFLIGIKRVKWLMSYSNIKKINKIHTLNDALMHTLKDFPVNHDTINSTINNT